MTDIQTNNKTYKVLVDGKLESVDSFNSTDLVLLLNNELVKKDGDNIKVEFVGEIITPNANYISLPKRFSVNESNINLTISLLKKYKDLKKDDKILLTNKIFSPSDKGIESPLFYFKKCYFQKKCFSFWFLKKVGHAGTSNCFVLRGRAAALPCWCREGMRNIVCPSWSRCL